MLKREIVFKKDPALFSLKHKIKIWMFQQKLIKVQ